MVIESCIEGSYEVAVEATIDGYKEQGSTTLHVLGAEAVADEEDEEPEQDQVQKEQSGSSAEFAFAGVQI